ncbi:MAG: ROK family protein [Bacteroidales bacterium]|nr:ROK family protein [Bacteroidales bacterium]
MLLGIDLGGTNLCIGLVEDDEVIKIVSVPSFAPSFTLEQTLEYLSERIAEVITPEVEKIGIGVPSVVDVEKGIVYDAANIPSWKEVHLKEFLEKRFGIPVNVNNDANCYAMGAYGKFPKDAKPEVLVTVTLGTGTGIGVVDHGRLFCGVNCGVGELGYLKYMDGCLEEYCSRQFFDRHGVQCHDAAKAAIEGDVKARELFEEFGRHLGYAVALLMYAYDPSHIVFGGGIANALPLFRPTMEAYIKENFPFAANVERLVFQAQTGGEVPIIGASLI